MNNVNIFVSSTCYDLSQVRADISELIQTLGHHPLMSEFENFPINPNKKTIENCVDIVNNYADILVLIVGNRYGSVIENGKSITNTEFLAAKNKGIPIFIFIDRKTLQALNFWKSNVDGDFSYIVDNKQIFNFIEDLRSNEQLWVFEFDRAQDISGTLKIQLSYLFKDALNIKKKFNAESFDFQQLNLSNSAMTILLKRDDTFEFEFFAQTLVDEISKKESLKNDYDYKIHLETKHQIAEKQYLLDWFSFKTASFIELMTSLSNLINKVAPIYIAEPGVPSDIKGLYYVSRTYARAFEKIILWTIDTHAAIVPDDCEKLKNLLAGFSKSIIDEVWKFPFDFFTQIHKYKLDKSMGIKPDHIQMTLTATLEDSQLDEFYDEFEIFKTNLFEEIKANNNYT